MRGRSGGVTTCDDVGVEGEAPPRWAALGGESTFRRLRVWQAAHYLAKLSLAVTTFNQHYFNQHEQVRNKLFVLCSRRSVNEGL